MKTDIIKAHKLRPGMAVEVLPLSASGWKEIILVSEVTKSGGTIEYTYWDLHDPRDQICGALKPKTKLRVLKGDERKAVIARVKEGIFKHLHSVEHEVAMIRLIEELP